MEKIVFILNGKQEEEEEMMQMRCKYENHVILFIHWRILHFTTIAFILYRSVCT